MLSRLSFVTRNVTSVPRLCKAVNLSSPCLQRLLSHSLSKNQEGSTSEAAPKSAWQLYKEKAGESGATMFGIGLAAYAFSKEILIIHEETLLAVVMAGTMIWLSKKIGPSVGKMLDARSNEILENMNKGRVAQMNQIESDIERERNLEATLATRKELFEIIKENSEMRLEAEHRRRLLEVEQEVQKRLDYQIDLQNLQRKIEQQHIANWLEQQVIRSITPQQEKDAIAQCIADISTMASSRTA